MTLGVILNIFGDGHGLPKRYHEQIKKLMQISYNKGISDNAKFTKDKWHDFLSEIGVFYEEQ